jgi:hypothetical protein
MLFILLFAWFFCLLISFSCILLFALLHQLVAARRHAAALAPAPRALVQSSAIAKRVERAAGREEAAASSTALARATMGLPPAELWSRVKRIATEITRGGASEWELKERALLTLKSTVLETSVRPQAWRSKTLLLLHKPLAASIAHRNAAVVKASYAAMTALAVVLAERAAPLLAPLVGAIALSGDGALPRAGLAKGECLFTVTFYAIHAHNLTCSP